MRRVTAFVQHDGSIRICCDESDLEIAAADLDDAIRALCSMRQSQDPENYERFVCELMPRIAVTSGEYRFRELGEPHAGAISAEGRTSVVIDD